MNSQESENCVDRRGKGSGDVTEKGKKGRGGEKKRKMSRVGAEKIGGA